MSLLAPQLALGDEAPAIPDAYAPDPRWEAAYAAWCAANPPAVPLNPTVEAARWRLFAATQLLLDLRAAAAHDARGPHPVRARPPAPPPPAAHGAPPPHAVQPSLFPETR